MLANEKIIKSFFIVKLQQELTNSTLLPGQDQGESLSLGVVITGEAYQLLWGALPKLFGSTCLPYLSNDQITSPLFVGCCLSLHTCRWCKHISKM